MRVALFSLPLACFLSSAALAADPVSLSVRVGGVPDGSAIPAKFAFCQADADTHSKDGGNFSPEISWSGGPSSTKSYVVIMHDPDVPTVFDDANQEGKTIPATLKRTDFTHWVLVDIPPATTRLPEGADSDRIEREGKRAQQTKFGVRGLNDYGSFMKGQFFGYDGPCPPWNDEVVHHYTFTVYAVNTPSLGLSGKFSRRDVLEAINGKIVAQGSVTGTYTQNPALLKPEAPTPTAHAPAPAPTVVVTEPKDAKQE